MIKLSFLREIALCTAASLLVAAGCASPLERSAEEAMREQLLASHRRYVSSVAAGPVIEVSRPPSEVERELTPERTAELDHMAGPDSYRGQTMRLGPDLQGNSETDMAGISLRRAIELAVKNNLNVEVARLSPAITQAQVIAAEAAFDAVFYSTLTIERTDTPRPGTAAGGFASVFGGVQEREVDALTTGIRKPLTTGGQFAVQTTFARNYDEPTFFLMPEYYTANVEMIITQPLLRGFGTDVNRAEILLAQSGRHASVQELRRALLQTASDTEQAYWTLYFARQRLLIQGRLLGRTEEDYERIKKRQDFDVSPVRKTEASSFVELRRSEVIRARQDVRVASDALKRLIHSSELPISGETLIIPSDEPADATIRFNLLDAVTTALQRRPELQSALLQIRDTAVRLRVADNARLPLLNVSATMRYNGLGGGVDSAYGRLTDGDFIDYILGAQFEQPIGNRAAEAFYTQRSLERRQAVTAYQLAAQDVVLEVKNAMRNLLTAYELIGSSRAGRRAAADNLRAIERQEEAGVALTPEFLLDLKLNSQQRLADAETQEVQALADYNTSIAAYYRALGTLLERSGIEFQDPTSERKRQ
ncbi:MAG: TolC family protein [Phycisphaeraceae bacterium]